MLGWEFPPFNLGGLGVASYYLAKYISKNNIKISFIVPFYYKNKNAPFLDLIDVFNKDFVDVIGLNEEFLFSAYLNISKEELEEIVKDILAKDLEIDFNKINNYVKYLSVILYSKLNEKIEKYKKKVLELYENKKINFDLIHCHDWPTYKAGMALKEKSGKKLILHVHSTEIDRSGFNPDPFKYNIELEAFKKADMIFAVSKRIKELIIKYYNVDESKIKVVYNGIEWEESNKNSELINKIKDKDTKIVLYLARITLHKGPDYLLRAAKLVIDWYKKHNKKDKVLFVFAGEGDMFKNLVNMSVELGINDNIIFTGPLKGEDVKKAYQLADVYVLPSISEPFGITPLEAIVWGSCPVIISKQSGVAEVLNHCFKVDFWDIEELANKIVSILNNQPLKETLIEHAREEVKNISWEKSAKTAIKYYLELYKK